MTAVPQKVSPVRCVTTNSQQGVVGEAELMHRLNASVLREDVNEEAQETCPPARGNPVEDEQENVDSPENVTFLSGLLKTLTNNFI